jgi:hypothetical protein
MRRITYLFHFALILGSASLIAGCDEEAKQSCSRDEECPRGQICDEGQNQCVAEACQSLSDCPGSGRTCLSETNTCSRKECGDAVGDCPEGFMCMMEGPYLWSCERVSPAVQDMLIIAPADASMDVLDTGMVASDAGMVMPDPYSGLCQTCNADRECDALGEGAQCTPIGNTGSFCTSSCGEGRPACLEGFTCLNQLNQCVPINYNCTVCPGRRCDDGLACDVTSGQCVAPRQQCEACTNDSTCAENHLCRAIENGQFCLEHCDEGDQCPADSACSPEGVCTPNTMRCDACGGRCAAPNSACIAETGMCGECNNDTPCAIGQFCDPATHTCSGDQPCACGIDAECANCGGRPICVSGSCVQCLDDTDCGARSTCNGATNQCEDSPCAGVVCQTGSQCDAQLGRCNPGCNSANDCVDAAIMDCNVQTGQCFYRDGTCDPANVGDGVCSPGSACTVNVLTMSSGCSCRKTDPDDFFSADVIIGCHPSFVCFQLPMTPDGVCIESPF